MLSPELAGVMAAFPKSVLTGDAGPPPCRTVDVYDNAPAPEQAHRIIRQARQQSPIAMGSVSSASRRSPGNYPNAQCGRAGGKASIERGHLRARLNPGRVEHAAVRQFESCPDPQLGQFPGGVGGEPEGLDLQFSQCVSRVITAAGPNGSDKYLGESDCGGCEFIIAVIQEDAGRASVVAVPTLQVRDEDTGVQDDHSGQSWRTSSRYPDP